MRLAARLVWGSLGGPRLTDDDRALLATGLGGIVLFDRNVESPEQVRALIADVRRHAPGPIRISIDQEGGHIFRVDQPLTRFPSPMAIAAVGDERIAHDVARASATELAALGIDVVLAPVLDVALDLRSPVVGARSFGADPDVVARLGAAMVRGYLAGGVLPVPKHFPGHGRTDEDSHLGVPVVDGAMAALEATDLPPFRAAVAAGAPALLTAHVVHAALDPLLPASLSTATTALARESLGFGGLLLTDALVMDAIAQRRRLDVAAVDAVAAGADAVMAIEATWRCLAGVEAALANGRLDPRRVADAHERAAAFDAAAARLRPARLSPAAAERHARLAARLARRSLTLVEARGLLPLDPAADLLVVDVASALASPIEAEPRGRGSVAAAVAARLPRARTIPLDPRTGHGLAEALELAARATRIVVLSRDAFTHPTARLAVGALGSERTIHVALRSPADLTLPGPAARIAAYSDTPATLDALAAALVAGRAAFRGRLPVELGAADREAAA